MTWSYRSLPRPRSVLTIATHNQYGTFQRLTRSILEMVREFAEGTQIQLTDMSHWTARLDLPDDSAVQRFFSLFKQTCKYKRTRKRKRTMKTISQAGCWTLEPKSKVEAMNTTKVINVEVKKSCNENTEKSQPSRVESDIRCMKLQLASLLSCFPSLQLKDNPKYSKTCSEKTQFNVFFSVKC